MSIVADFPPHTTAGTSPVEVRVQLFALARELAGTGALLLVLPAGATVATLRGALVERVPPLAPLASHLLIAVDNDYAEDHRPLLAGQQLACFPPVSGG